MSPVRPSEPSRYAFIRREEERQARARGLSIEGYHDNDMTGSAVPLPRRSGDNDSDSESSSSAFPEVYYTYDGPDYDSDLYDEDDGTTIETPGPVTPPPVTGIRLHRDDPGVAISPDAEQPYREPFLAATHADEHALAELHRRTDETAQQLHTQRLQLTEEALIYRSIQARGHALYQRLRSLGAETARLRIAIRSEPVLTATHSNAFPGMNRSIIETAQRHRYVRHRETEQGNRCGALQATGRALAIRLSSIRGESLRLMNATRVDAFGPSNASGPEIPSRLVYSQAELRNLQWVGFIRREVPTMQASENDAQRG